MASRRPRRPARLRESLPDGQQATPPLSSDHRREGGRSARTVITGRCVLLLTLLVSFADGRVGADETFLSKGVKINYKVKGEGAPVILIHGWLSSGWINWELPGTVALLAKDHRVIWLDLPAHGLSDKPAQDAAYGPELVEHVIRLMDHLQLRRTHLVGYSMGGIITAKLLVEHPNRVASAVLGGMGWLREGSLEQKVFAAGGKDGKPVGICFRSLAQLALTEKEIKSIHVPVLVLFGDRDFLKAGYVQPLKTVRQDWPVVDIRDADHITCVLKPQFREEIHKWLAQHGPRSSTPNQE